MTPLVTVVAASYSSRTVGRVQDVLAGLPVEVMSLSEVAGDEAAPTERGDNMQNRVLARARFVARTTMLLTVADASCLDVAALGGLPGFRGQYRASSGTDADQNADLLRRLQEVEDSARTATFRAVVACVDPWQVPTTEHVGIGECAGTIAHNPAGTGGFGYDALFVIDEVGKTFAEIDDAVRRRLSHRRKAFDASSTFLREAVERRISDARGLARGLGA